MKFAAIFLSASLMAGTAWGDIYSSAIQQARRAGNLPPNNSAPAAPQPPPVNPVLTATLQNISALRADLTAIANASDPAGASPKISLLNDLIKAAQGTKPPVADVEKLAGHLTDACAGKKKLQPENLARNLHALFNSSHLSAVQQKTLMAGAKKSLTDAGVATADADEIADDLQMIADATK